MIPDGTYIEEEENEFELIEESNKTYYLDEKTKTIRQYCDGIEAIKQAIYKILNTERYESEIYDWDYGVEIKEILGSQEGYAYVQSKLKANITEALMEDERILSIENFQMEKRKKSIWVRFDVITNIGDVAVEKEVT